MKNTFLSIAISVLALSMGAAPAHSQSEDNRAEVLFVKGWADDKPDFLQSKLNGFDTYMLVFDQREGRRPIDGKVAVKEGVFVVTNGQYREEIYAGDPILSEMSLIYEDGKIVDFYLDWTSGLNPTTDLGIIHARGNRSYFDVLISEKHSEDAPVTYGDWERREGFGVHVTRTPLNEYCAQGLVQEDYGLKQSNTLGCFWQENKSGNYCWVDANPANLTFEQCQARDSCDGGGGDANTGCYKYSHGHAAAGMAWK